MRERRESAAGTAVAEPPAPVSGQQSFAGSLRRPSERSWLFDTLGALVLSRAIVFAAGIAGFLALGDGPDAKYDFLGLTGHLGPVGNALAAPVIPWDGVWYIALALHGYQHTTDAAYYPLYPLAIAMLDTVTSSAPLSAFLISIASLFGTLALLQRLTALELGEAAARRTVYLFALFPTAIFLSAAYPEALFLCLDLGALLAARRERWALAGILGGLGAAARNSGFLIVVPLALMYLSARRAETAALAGAGIDVGAGAGSALRERLRARWRSLDVNALWLCLVPLGLLTVVLFNVALFGDPLAAWHAEAYWQRGFAGPLSALWQGVTPAVKAVSQIAAGHVSTGALQKLALLGLALAALFAAVGVLRRLPPAYGAYTVIALIWALSAPEKGHPLASTPRFILAIFPLFMWLGWRLEDRRKLLAVLALFTLGLVYCSVRFATWHWVA